MSRLSLLDEARLTALNLGDSLADLVSPSLRVGVTGLSRAGKTVFLTALVHALTRGADLPAFRVRRGGRFIGAALAEQPDDAVPRFEIEQHIRDLVDERVWPESTRKIAELRLTLRYEPESAVARALGRRTLTLDLVDYPGEWLLDLPLLDMDYRAFCDNALAKARAPERAVIAAPFLELLAETDPDAALDEEVASRLAAAFTNYLRACREGENALSMLPPGRFLMPGDLEGSPALTFAPLDLDGASDSSKASLKAAMDRRFEAYKRIVVRPFFRDHFARLDRQVVLVDAMASINAGSAAILDLQDAMTAILRCFRTGGNSLLSGILGPKIDKIVFAATKADHIHQSQHETLETILEHLVTEAKERAVFSGAKVETLAVSSVRATREASASRLGEKLAAVAGTPMAGERIDGETFDGEREVAIFPGDLPTNPSDLMNDKAVVGSLRFVKFRPPKLEGATPRLPNIRMDRLLEFLLGDKLS